MSAKKEAKDRHARKKLELMRSHKEVPCADCGGVFPPYVMDFDHVTGEKELNVSRALRVSVARMLAEIAKCEVVCSNCHRIRTYERRQH